MRKLMWAKLEDMAEEKLNLLESLTDIKQKSGICVKSKIKRFLYGLTAVMVLLISLSACGSKTADISSYGDTPITIAGLQEEEFTVTPNELAELECVSRTASGATAKAGTVSAYGPLLDTFLAEYGYKASDFDRIRFICADEYRVVLKDEFLTDYETVLTISNNSEPLAEEYQPLRLLIPGTESNKWAYSIVRIEFEFPEE